jgi:hypothetical protein
MNWMDMKGIGHNYTYFPGLTANTMRNQVGLPGCRVHGTLGL